MRPVRRGAHCSVTPAAARVRNRDAAEDLDTGCAGMTSRFAGPPMIRALAAGGASWEDGREEACRERLPGGHAVSHRERSRGGADHAAVTRTSARPFRELGLAVLEIEARAVAALAERLAGAHINVSVAQEACPLDLAPTASTTAALAMGDALAIALLEARGFTREDFARSHPGGRLGRRLLLHVKGVMRSGAALPLVAPEVKLSAALREISRKGMGMTAVVDERRQVLGIFTDGDLRRAMDHELDVHSTRICEVMTRNCKTVHADILAAEATQIMDSAKINGLLVVDDAGTLIGALSMHDLLRAGVV